VKKGAFGGWRRGPGTEEKGVERKQHGCCLDWWDAKSTGAGGRMSTAAAEGAMGRTARILE